MVESARGVDDLHFERMDPSALSKERWDEVVQLRHDYYSRTLRGRPTGHVEMFVSHTTQDSWDNPNTSDLRGSYARAMVVAAFDKHDDLVGFSYTADNASSDRPQPQNSAERLAKLYLPRYIEGRYHWQRELVDNGDGRPGLREALAALSIKGRLKNKQHLQPMSVWIMGEEYDLQEEASAWGFTAHTKPEERGMFGEGTMPTHLTMYKANSKLEVFDRLLDRPNGQSAVSFAMQHVK
ncbi:MAG TPA: hypothetical protein VK694_05055 [Verrucomicrobiae bacterium]|nr:hypothetical protein [Verrucomicrobiae bacterium]